MNKKIKLKVENLATLKKSIRNAFTPEGADAAEAINEMLDSLAASDVEYDVEGLANEMKSFIEKLAGEKVEEEVANQLAKRMQAMQNGIKKDLPKEVRNEVAKAILSSHGRDEVRSAVENVMTKNGISGLSFADVVDYAVVDGWGNSNPLFAKLKEVPFNKFFYTDSDLSTAEVLAKQWDEATKDTVLKSIQSVELEGKAITPRYVYKRQQMDRADLSRLEKSGGMATFLAWLNEELDRQIVNTIVLAMLVGDTINAQGARVTSFETIGTKNVSDAFTSVLNPEVAKDVTLADVRRLCDAVKNPYGKDKWLICSSALLTSISAFVYAAGGSTDFISTDALKEKLGVSEIYVTDMIDSSTGLHAIAMLPEGYWYTQDEYISVSYPTWEKNVENYQKERNIGGAIHDMLSTAVLKEATA